MALTTARISSSRWRPPGLGGGIKSLIRSHSASVRSVGYGVVVIPPVYRTGATYGRLFKQPLRSVPCDDPSRAITIAVAFCCPQSSTFHPSQQPQLAEG